jgi:hypothetical protein
VPNKRDITIDLMIDDMLAALISKVDKVDYLQDFKADLLEGGIYGEIADELRKIVKRHLPSIQEVKL